MKTSSCHLTDAIVELCLEAPGEEVAPRHLRRCEACRLAVALARRSLDVWRRDRAGADEIAAARDRLALRSAHVLAPRPPAWIVAFALVLLGGGALAAFRPWERPRVRPADPAPLEPHEAPRASTQGHRATAEIAASRAADEPAPPAPGESAAPPLASAAPSSPPPAPREVAAVAGSAASVAPVAVEVAPAASASSSWQEVAAAMRQGDKRAADDALTKLERAPDAATRDAARLARAELAIASGRSADAQAPLADLAAHGATPLVRRRAAELLTAH